MKKSTTKTAAKATVVVAAEPVADVAVAKAAPKAKAPKAAKAEKKDVVAEVVPALPSPVETVAVEEDVGASLHKSIADLQEQLANLKTATSAATSALKTIEKQAARVIKKADRRRKRKTEAVEGAEPKPCIFTKPVKITAELCSFLGKPKDTEVSRSSVTKGVMEYARNNGLMDKQTIKADAALRKLLTLNEGDVLTILNLQKYLRRHYVKAPVATA